MNCQQTTFVISLLLSTSLYPAATPARSCDGSNASASATPAAEVKKMAAETAVKEFDQKIIVGSSENDAAVAAIQKMRDLKAQFEDAKKLHEAAVIDRVDEEGYTPLHRAAQRGDLGMMRALIAYGADFDATHQGKTLSELLDPGWSGSNPLLKDIIENGAFELDKDVTQCLAKQWYQGRPLKKWLGTLMEQDDVQTFRRMFRSDRPNIQALIPLLYHGVALGAVRIVRDVLAKLELCSLSPQTKNRILSSALMDLSWMPYRSRPRLNTGFPIIQEFVCAGYDPFRRTVGNGAYAANCDFERVASNLPIESKLLNDLFIKIGVLFAEENIDHPLVDRELHRCAGLTGDRRYIDLVASMKRDMQKRVLEQRVLPQRKIIIEALMATDHIQKNSFKDIAPLIQAYVGLPRLSVPLSDEQGIGERIKRFGYKMIRSIKERIGYLG